MGRTPPVAVRRTLRQEVGFRCPVADCGRPYLTWHHFDPPWAEEEHHRPEGMIALCLEHAAKADGGAFTKDQLLAMKATGAAAAQAVQGQFDWMRRELLVIAGSNFYFEQPLILQVGDRPCIWLSRNADETLLLNFCMPTVTADPRAYIINNGWVVPPDVGDIECPPQGRSLLVRYPNGDRFQVHFFGIGSEDELDRRYPDAGIKSWGMPIAYPIAGVEVSETAAESRLEFGPRESRLPGGVLRNGMFARNGGAAIHLDDGSLQFPPVDDEESAGV